MLLETKTLLADLTTRTEANLAIAQTLQALPENKLRHRNAPNAWNALECIAHLNLYGNFYVPEINLRLNNATKPTKSQYYRSGWLGNYFAKSMLPGAKGMKTFKEMNTLNTLLKPTEIDKFIDQQNQMLAILKRCEGYDLGRVKTSISISKLIKLRLADTLRVVIYHNQRHLAQATQAVKS